MLSQQRSSGYRALQSPSSLIRIPTRIERPDLDYLDDKTPVLYYGKPTSNFQGIFVPRR